MREGQRCSAQKQGCAKGALEHTHMRPFMLTKAPPLTPTPHPPPRKHTRKPLQAPTKCRQCTHHLHMLGGKHLP
jgi:hypothetical protein